MKFGDNDTLSAVTSSMIHADFLVLLTDVDGLYTANPRKDPTAKQVEVVESVAAIRSQGPHSALFVYLHFPYFDIAHTVNHTSDAFPYSLHKHPWL